MEIRRLTGEEDAALWRQLQHARIADTYHAWRGEADAGSYTDEPGFCKSAPLAQIAEHGYVLTPGRYVGAAAVEEDDTPFPERFAALREQLEEQFANGDRLTLAIRRQLDRIGLPE